MFLQLMQYGLAQIPAISSNSILNDHIRFANSQQDRSRTNLPDFVLQYANAENIEKSWIPHKSNF